MGQKINPVSLRLHYTNRHFDSCWYSNYFYKKLIIKDVFLQQYFNNFLKLLKLPSGRYSIQHLQKKTQVYNFLCYPKYTREWRSKVFGLTKKKNVSKKARYFFKTQIQLKKRIKKHIKLHSFYTALNQQAIHKIQKKITSFQNPKLWSKLKKTSKKLTHSMDLVNSSSSIQNNFVVFPRNQLLINTLKTPNLYNTNNKTVLIQKIHDSPTKNSQVHHKILKLFSTSSWTNSYSIFLKNLLIYKTIKSNLKIKNNSDTFSANKFSRFHLNFKKQKKSRLFNTLNFKYKNYLEYSLSSLYKLEMDFIPFKVRNDWQHANFLADEIVYFLEKRIPFRRLKSKILKQLSKISQIRGVRITCSGRVGGKSKKAQRAKTECIKYGQTSLQVFSSKIDFSVKTAFTSFGSVGVKVWICYN